MLRQTLALGFMLLALAGCAQSYTTPGGPADFSKLGLTEQSRRALTDSSVQKILDKKPLVTFPATIAVARVQAGDYESYTYQQHYYAPAGRTGAYSVITTRDIEKDEDIEAIAKLPQVAGVATMKRILLDKTLNNDLELRNAAAKLHANLLLYYTFDTAFETETKVRPLGVITLGLAPNKNARVTCTASAVLMDVNNGYIYAVVEATKEDHQLTNAWESSHTLDDVRKRVEREAFTDLLTQFKSEWPIVLATYNHPAIASPAAPPPPGVIYR